MEWSEIVAAFNGPVGGGAVMFAFGLFALTGRIVWHTSVDRERARGDKWEALALDLLQTNKTLAGAAATGVEVAAATIPTEDLEVPE